MIFKRELCCSIIFVTKHTVFHSIYLWKLRMLLITRKNLKLL